jgi:hypothetical protein
MEELYKDNPNAESASRDWMDKDMFMVLSAWNGDKAHCVYLNDHRIAGGKPWGGGATTKRWRLTVRDLARAIPELRPLLGVNCYGKDSDQL